MPAHCAAFGCASRYKDEASSHSVGFFSVPKNPEVRQVWEAVLLQQGTFSANSKICEKHFRDEDILKTWTHNVDSKPMHIERERWALKKNAVPVFSWATPQAADRTNAAAVRETEEEAAQEERQVPNTTSFADKNEQVVLLQNELRKQAEFQGWSVHNISADTIVLCKLRVDKSLAKVHKAVIINSSEPATVNAGGKVVPPEYLPCPNVTDFAALSQIINFVEQSNICSGYDKDCPNGTADLHCPLRAESCRVLVQGKICPHCRRKKKPWPKSKNNAR